MKISFRITAMILPLFLALFSCGKNMEIINEFIDAETEPDVVVENMVMFYSDSARLQSKLVAPLVIQFNTEKEQRREFPKGLHVWLYETTGDLKAEITANRATHDMEANLWEASSNVVLINSDGQKLETEQLFWDPKKGIVYSEKYTKITNKNGTVASGESFTSNQDFKNAQLFRGKATIVMEDDDETEPENEP